MPLPNKVSTLFTSCKQTKRILEKPSKTNVNIFQSSSLGGRGGGTYLSFRGSCGNQHVVNTNNNFSYENI